MKLILSTILVLTFSTFYVYAASLSQLQTQQNLNQWIQQLLNRPDIQQVISQLPQNIQNLINQLIGSKDIWSELTNIGSQVITYIPTIISIINLLGKRQLVIPDIQALFQQFGGSIQQILSQYPQLQAIISTLIGLLPASKDFWSELLNIGNNLLSGILTDPNILTSILGGLLGGKRSLNLNLSSLLSLIPQQYQSLINSAIAFITNLINGNSKDLQGSFNELGNNITLLLSNLVNTGLATILGVFGGIGKRQLSTSYIQTLLALFGGNIQQVLNLIPAEWQALALQIINSLGKRQLPQLPGF